MIESLAAFWRRTRRGKSAENDIGRLRRIFGQCCGSLKIRKHTPRIFRNAKYASLEVADARSGQFIPARRLEDVTPTAISRYLQHRLIHDRLSAKTVNHLRAVLSQLFNYAKRYEGYRCPHPDYHNPIEGVDRFPEPALVIEWLTTEDIAEQLDALNEYPSFRSLVATYIYAGLRRSEALWLTPADIDFEKKVIKVQTKVLEGEQWQTKTGRVRTVPISTKLLEELQRYLPTQKGTWAFPSPDGKRWHPDNFSNDLREANHSKGLNWSCMEYRHTFGSHLAQKGVSLYEISTLMGNSPEICRKHYAALLPEKMHDRVEF